MEPYLYTRDDQGVPVLETTVAGRKVAISCMSIKRTMLARGVVSVGDDFADVLPVIALPAEPGLNAMTLHGFSDDPDLVEVVREWIATIDAGTYSAVAGPA